jgi:hypothetical protein
MSTEVDTITHIYFAERGIYIPSSEQTGGAILSIDGFRYEYKKINETSRYVIHGGLSHVPGKSPCFILFIDNDGHAELFSLKNFLYCSMDPNAPPKMLVKAALTLAKRGGAQRIKLTDNSSKYLDNDSDKRFILSDMYFLTEGLTWYQSIIPGLRTKDMNTLFFWQTVVRMNTWDFVYGRLVAKFGNVEIPVDISDIDTREPGSAMQIFKRIKEAKTLFFVKYGSDLMDCSSISSLYGWEWYGNI